MGNQELRDAGLKVTTQRMKILQILDQTGGEHLSAEAVYQMLRDAGEEVGLATVYRVLTQFVTAGLVKRHNFEGDFAVFELDKGDHHDHLVCLKCGSVEEFLDDVIEERQALIAGKSNFKMTDHNLTIYGICHRCE